MKIVINKCFGGYGVSPEAALWLFERGFDGDDFRTPVLEYWNPTRKGNVESREKALKEWGEYLAGENPDAWITVFTPDEKFVLDTRPEPRNHPLLVECVETLGKKANGNFASLKIVEIPDGVDWEIDEYDGQENVHEKHRSWG